MVVRNRKSFEGEYSLKVGKSIVMLVEKIIPKEANLKEIDKFLSRKIQNLIRM